jgi:ABC-2 type transport system ATP-binding protein
VRAGTTTSSDAGPTGSGPGPRAAIPAIETFGLTRRFGPTLAVDDLRLRVEADGVFGLLGPNGAGKTTTIKMLITLLPPTSGTATVAGFPIDGDTAAVRARIGYVPQLVSADGVLTGRENLQLSARLYRLPRAEQGGRIAEALSLMGLDEPADRLVRTYSGGMVRRLEIAQAMLHRPPVLFLDEPTVGLDPVARATMWTHIRELREASGTTIVLTTHYMEEADALCDRIALMHKGRVVADGSPQALKAATGPGATLDDVFAALTIDAPESGGTFRDLNRSRRTARRLG